MFGWLKRGAQSDTAPPMPDLDALQGSPRTKALMEEARRSAARAEAGLRRAFGKIRDVQHPGSVAEEISLRNLDGEF